MHFSPRKKYGQPPPPKKKNVQNMTPTFAHYQSSKPLSLKIGQKKFGFCLGWGPNPSKILVFCVKGAVHLDLLNATEWSRESINQ